MAFGVLQLGLICWYSLLSYANFNQHLAGSELQERLRCFKLRPIHRIRELIDVCDQVIELRAHSAYIQILREVAELLLIKFLRPVG